MKTVWDTENKCYHNQHWQINHRLKQTILYGETNSQTQAEMKHRINKKALSYISSTFSDPRLSYSTHSPLRSPVQHSNENHRSKKR